MTPLAELRDLTKTYEEGGRQRTVLRAANSGQRGTLLEAGLPGAAL